MAIVIINPAAPLQNIVGRSHPVNIFIRHVFGKAATVLFYAVVAVIILWGDRLDPVIVNFLCVCAALAAILALVLYFFSYLRGKKMGISRKTSNVSEDGSSN